MTTILDLPDEIYPLIGKHLSSKSIYSCIRVCRSFYSTFIPYLWSNPTVQPYEGRTIDAIFLRSNAHRIKSIVYSPNLTEDYYAITFPRLHTLRLESFFTDEDEPQYLEVPLAQKVDFLRRHPFVKRLSYHHKDTLPREFWEIIRTEWTALEKLEFSGFVEADDLDVFWAVCERVHTLYLSNVNMLTEGCWPELCELEFNDGTVTDQDLAAILRSFPSRRLTFLSPGGRVTFGPLTYSCLQEMYFGHLRVLRIEHCLRVTSTMTQEILTKCVHLVDFSAPYIYVRDVVGTPKPWGCSKLENLKIFVAKLPDDEAEWEGRLFEQISKLRQLLILNLEPYPLSADSESSDLKTLDFRLLPSPSSSPENSRDDDEGGDKRRHEGIRSWSSLVQLQQFAFDEDRQRLGLEEALWMVQHWQDLVAVHGSFKAAEGDDGDKLKRLFDERGVEHYT
ncbi:hypothetical protein BG015_011386 [Linnemannia schmuckeri]|uniref:F-box domain-containing protein n=1 Tax=Linnemannia schmuckeri TaxID=64567 RepID=A0A9P5RSS3_9FUNG|nr:hypothetical protein BG015_011386 [Linnemannia schmuckeri]